MHTFEMVVRKPPSTTRTWAAIVFCLFVILPTRLFINRISPQPTVAGDGLREAIILACAAGLLLYVHYVEKLPFTSIGIGTSVWWKSAVWAARVLKGHAFRRAVRHLLPDPLSGLQSARHKQFGDALPRAVIAEGLRRVAKNNRMRTTRTV